MSDAKTIEADVIESLGELIAHALELEHASEAHYSQLADSMAVHHNAAVETLFRQLAELSTAHAAATAARVGDTELPRIPPWGFKWECPGAPESSDCLEGDVNYRMTTLQAIEIALHNERRGHAYYLHVAATATDADARALAAEMAAEEAEHIAMLEALLAAERRTAQAPAPDDLDPPHMPA
jgi:rubrerythrin